MSEICVPDKATLSVMKKQKRREKSRDAARCRRHKESDAFDNICDNIPVPNDIVTHLDKCAIMRLFISYMKLRKAMDGNADSFNSLCETPSYLSDADYVNATNSFLIILSSDLDILYVSDNVKEYLGLSKFDLIGQNIMTYTHESDYDDLRECFDKRRGFQNFFLRLKSTLTVDNKSINLKSASYKVLRCSGVVHSNPADDTSHMIAHLEPIPHPANIQYLLDSMTFVSQHSPDMKFTYCDERFASLLEYEDSDLIDHSFYDFCHAADLKLLGEFCQKLYRINQVETSKYRFLAKSGGYHWIVTQATVIANEKNHKPQYVVCVHYVVSGLECGKLPLSIEQMKTCSYIEDSAPAIPQSVDLSDIAEVDAGEKEVSTKVCDPVSFVSANTELLDPIANEDMEDDDNCCVAPLTFSELDDSDQFLDEDLYYNAPSIGDPWSYNDGDVKSTLGKASFNPEIGSDMQPSLPFSHMSDQLNLDLKKGSLLKEEDEMFSKLNSDWKWRDTPNNSFDSITPTGSVSPCDSAYFGSPRSESLSPVYPYIDPNLKVCDVKNSPDVVPSTIFRPINALSPLCTNSVQNPIFPSISNASTVSPCRFTSKPPSISPKQSKLYQPQVYQCVEIPSENYSQHLANMKRGYVEEDPLGSGIVLRPPKKRKGESSACTKKRRFDCGDSQLLLTQQPLLPKELVSSQDPYLCNQEMRANILLQPGESFGYDVQDDVNSATESLASFLLQPELKVENNGKQLFRNSSYGFLPELSLVDCEVNAPIERSHYLPVAAECVHLLDIDN